MRMLTTNTSRLCDSRSKESREKETRSCQGTEDARLGEEIEKAQIPHWIVCNHTATMLSA